jgi:hypothetical protein
MDGLMEELVYVALVVDEMEESSQSNVFDLSVTHYQKFETFYDPPLAYTWSAFERNYPLVED